MEKQRNGIRSLPLAVALLSGLAASGEEFRPLLPEFPVPTHLIVVDISEYDHIEYLRPLAALQGLVNRETPGGTMIYLNGRSLYPSGVAGQQFWLNYYVNEFGITTQAMTYEQVFEWARTNMGIRHYVVFDNNKSYIWPDLALACTRNVAHTLAGLFRAIPIRCDLVTQFDQWGYEVLPDTCAPANWGLTPPCFDLVNQWASRPDVIAWAQTFLLPLCPSNALALVMDGEYLENLTDIVEILDYTVGAGLFHFWLHPIEADDTQYRYTLYDRDALDAVYERFPPLTPVIGWSMPEPESIQALAAHHHFLVPMDHSFNWSVHAGLSRRIRAEHPRFSQGWHDFDFVPLDTGAVYLAWQYSDGDHLNVHQHLMQGSTEWGNWTYPERGAVPAGWTLQPFLYELGAGMLKYFYDTRAPEDVFIDSSPLGYTLPDAPRFGADLPAFLDLVGRYLDRLDLHAPWAANYRGADLVFDKRETMPHLAATPGVEGFFLSYRGAGAERGVYWNRGDIPVVPVAIMYEYWRDPKPDPKGATNFYKVEIQKAIDTIPQRPLFLYVQISNWDLTPAMLEDLWAGLQAANPDLRLVNPARFVALLRQAKRTGAYPFHFTPGTLSEDPYLWAEFLSATSALVQSRSTDGEPGAHFTYRFDLAGTTNATLNVRISGADEEVSASPDGVKFESLYEGSSAAPHDVALSLEDFFPGPDVLYVRFSGIVSLYDLDLSYQRVPDADVDDLPDPWEEQYFGHTTNCRAAEDRDDDGHSAREEYVAGTDPTDKASCFKLSFDDEDPGYTLKWTSAAGRCYAVKWCTNLLTDTFAVLGTASNVPASPDGVNAFTNDIITDLPALFYRVSVSEAP